LTENYTSAARSKTNLKQVCTKQDMQDALNGSRMTSLFQQIIKELGSDRILDQTLVGFDNGISQALTIEIGYIINLGIRKEVGHFAALSVENNFSFSYYLGKSGHQLTKVKKGKATAYADILSGGAQYQLTHVFNQVRGSFYGSDQASREKGERYLGVLLGAILLEMGDIKEMPGTVTIGTEELDVLHVLVLACTRVADARNTVLDKSGQEQGVESDAAHADQGLNNNPLGVPGQSTRGIKRTAPQVSSEDPVEAQHRSKRQSQVSPSTISMLFFTDQI
jgi:hypothetical protein